MKKFAFAILMSLCAATAMAGEVYGQIGTEGLGLGYAQGISDKLNVRAEVNSFSKSYSQDGGDLNYDGKLKLGNVAVLGDFYPFGGNFRITSGAIVNKGKLTGTATGAAGTYTLNGVDYAYAGGDTVEGEVKFGDVNPYLGIGYGHKASNKGLSFFADFGVIFQNPKASLNVTGNLATTVAAADIEAERKELQDAADKFKYYPVVKVGVSYAF